jgi:hypothetical protein
MVNFYAPKYRTWRVLSSLISLLILLPGSGFSATWTQLTNPAPFDVQIMVQMTDGTILVQSYDDAQSWAKLTPDATGSYINGTWTVLAKALLPQLYFASQILSDGRFWMAGGEYTGPALQANWGNFAEIYDPVANTWTAVAPFPAQAGCPSLKYISGNEVTGSPIITGIYPYTTGLTIGETVTGTGIPGATTIVSIDSPTQITLSKAATSSGTARTINLANAYTLSACLGDEPSSLLPGGIILVGDLVNRNTWLYNVGTNSWSMSGAKVYNDQSDEEGWAKLPNGTVINYDLFQSKSTGGSYAEIYNPTTGTWSGISPSDGTATGFIPQLSSNAIGSELGPLLRLQDGRVIVIGATQHTAIYNPTTNNWAAGPDIMGTLSNSANPGGTLSPFGADDAPAAIVPNGHVIFGADAGISQFTSTGNITTGSKVITNIPSTAILQIGWTVAGTGIPSGSTIASVDSSTQITISANATATTTGVSIKFGGTFSSPTQLFDFNPTTNTISPISPAIPDPNLPTQGVYPCRMLTLPTGQVMFSDSGNILWVYTADGAASPALRPVVNNITYNGGGMFTLTGKQLNGQSAGAAYGDDDQMDTNYPLVRLTATDGSGNVYYGKTTNWSSVAVGGGLTAPQTVNFTLNPALTTPGNYALAVGGAGIASAPVFVNITQAEISKQ